MPRTKKPPLRPLTARENAGIAIRYLHLADIDRFRFQAAARPNMNQAAYLVALLDLADDLRTIADQGVDSVSARAILERHGLQRVSF